MTEQVQGGVAWELSEAIKLMGEAMASGDQEQIATAMRRHAEALSNSATATLVPTLKHVLESVVKSAVDTLSASIDSVKAHQDQRFGYVLREMEAEFGKNAAWRDTYSKEIDEIRNEMKQQTSFQRESQEDRRKLREELSSLRGEFTTFRDEVRTYMDSNRRAEFDAMKARLEELARRAGHDG